LSRSYFRACLRVLPNSASLTLRFEFQPELRTDAGDIAYASAPKIGH
jgi:hypothetical protein